MNDFVYDYREETKKNIREYVTEYIKCDSVAEKDRDDIVAEIYEQLWDSDSVTGNASGSYTFSRYLAQKCVQNNWDLLIDALSEFGYDVAYLGEAIMQGNWERLDVIIRCYVLYECVCTVVDEVASK